MGMLEIVGGGLLILLCAVIVIAVTMQESKSGLGTIGGGDTGSFYDKNRGRTKDAMLVRVTSICGVAVAVITLAVLFASVR